MWAIPALLLCSCIGTGQAASQTTVTAPRSEGEFPANADQGDSQIRGEVWADNWFALYVGEQLVIEDSTSITTERSFNAEMFVFDAVYPPAAQHRCQGLQGGRYRPGIHRASQPTDGRRRSYRPIHRRCHGGDDRGHRFNLAMSGHTHRAPRSRLRGRVRSASWSRPLLFFMRSKSPPGGACRSLTIPSGCRQWNTGKRMCAPKMGTTRLPGTTPHS